MDSKIRVTHIVVQTKKDGSSSGTATFKDCQTCFGDFEVSIPFPTIPGKLEEAFAGGILTLEHTTVKTVEGAETPSYTATWRTGDQDFK